MEPIWLLVSGLALTGFCLLAYSLRVLDARGALLSFGLGAVVLLAGGLRWLLMMVVFTALAFVATRAGRRIKQARGTAEAREGERGAPNVIANGLAPGLAALAALALDPAAAAMAYVTAVCAITSDTLASEVGGLSARARCVLPPFVRQRPGTNGAVSLLGQTAALLGPVAVAAVAVPVMDLSWTWMWIPVVGGFLGSQIDSLLGATLERDDLRPERPLSKGDVNFVASFIPTALVLLVLHVTGSV